MNKLTRVGLSALCGSLSAVSVANAGDMTVTGGVDMSWISLSGGDGVTGNPIGMGSNLTFKGSGELDNGWTFDLTVAMLNQDAYSNTNVTIDMLGFGKLDINQGNSGNGIDAFDDKMPTAWEETWGAGLGTGIYLVRGVGTTPNIQYSTPTAGGVSLTAAWANDVGSSKAADGASGGGTADITGSGYDLTMNINPTFGTEILSGLNLFVAGHTTKHYKQATNSDDIPNDRYEGTGGITLDIGPLSLGAQAAGVSTGLKGTGTSTDYYKNSAYGISFNINDDLSVSYGNHKSQQQAVSPSAQEAVHLEITSWQIAYTMGGASVRLAETDVSNGSYQTTNNYDKEARILSVSLAF